jgi:hypothetical protein
MLLAEFLLELRNRRHSASLCFGRPRLLPSKASNSSIWSRSLWYAAASCTSEFSLPVDGEHNRVAAFTHLGDKLRGVAFELAEGMNVFVDVDDLMPPGFRQPGKLFPVEAHSAHTAKQAIHPPF